MSIPTVQWRDDGTPVSPRFGDIYRSSSGLTQAREVFLRGCGLLPDDVVASIDTSRIPGSAAGATPQWANTLCWSVLETGFGLGLNFLATWQAWQAEPARPQRLFYSAIEAYPPDAADLLRSAAPYPELQPLAEALAAQWHGLLPGVHRLSLDQGRVQLTLAVGDVRAMLGELTGTFDSIYLDGFDPQRNPDMWSLPVLKAVTRLARPGARAATWSVAASVREGLTTCGFVVERVPGPPPKRSVLRATLAPHWLPRRRVDPQAAVRAPSPGRCAVVGGGLAGASVAYSLVQRGWNVTVFDAADTPASGASGLPAGVVAPHVSPDDRPVSRLTRAGTRATLARAAALLQEGVDFAATGVLERHAPGERRLPPPWLAGAGHADSATAPESWPDSDERTRQRAQAAGAPLGDAHQALWHSHAGWVRPAALVRAMLKTSGVEWRGGQRVTGLRIAAGHWQVMGSPASAKGEPPSHGSPLPDSVLGQFDLVFVTAGFGSLALLPSDDRPRLPLHALRGQVAWGPMPTGALDAAALAAFPVNGHGSLIAHLPGQPGPWWVTGSTFERGETRPLIRAEDQAHNRERLAELLPGAAAALAEAWNLGQVQDWAGVRATLPDRLPAVGAWGSAASAISGEKQAPAQQESAPKATETGAKIDPLPVHVLTGLGARGLTLAVLCGEIAATWLHGEPLPVEGALAHKLRAGRFRDGTKATPAGGSEEA